MRKMVECPSCNAKLVIEYNPPAKENPEPNFLVLLNTDELAVKISDQLEMRWRE